MNAIFGMSGYLEVGIIVLVFLLLFGNRLPGVARSMGKSIIEFKKGLKGSSKESLPDGDDEKNEKKQD